MEIETKPTEELRHLQKVLLEMMKQIDMLCRKHNITYYLNGGNALGAVRHNGFIPWDDDFDIMMKYEDYSRFINICRSELDPAEWYVQEAWKDWPGCFSKIRLKKTYLADIGEWEGIDKDNRGIYIDIFPIVNSPESKNLRLVQYTAAKLLNSYSLVQKNYKGKTLLKKLALGCSRLLKINIINRFCNWCVFRYEKKQTDSYGNFFGMSRFRNAFYRKEVFQLPSYHQYEDIELPLPTLYDEYLRQSFGDYMKLPPIEQQKPAHSLKIDFGKY
ncbi:MAG: LicD family protein [Muribaculaceae bacterium]|nr:LicD family protein [Muribaculaceae bacterium]MDE6753217.1 LicD family protein [Muribaculaceae bacterium]